MHAITHRDQPVVVSKMLWGLSSSFILMVLFSAFIYKHYNNIFFAASTFSTLITSNKESINSYGNLWSALVQICKICTHINRERFSAALSLIVVLQVFYEKNQNKTKALKISVRIKKAVRNIHNLFFFL